MKGDSEMALVPRDLTYNGLIKIFDEQYTFTEDETFGDFIGEKDSEERVNCDSQNFDGESDIGGEYAASDRSHSSGDHDDNIVGNTTTKRDSFVVPHPWSVLGIRRSSKARFQATCKDDNCSFRVYARKMDKGEYWQIRKFNKEHSCTIESFQERSIDWNEYEVKCGGKDGLVNLLDRTCSCREFQIDLLSCAYALATLRACKTPFIDFCSHYYTKSSLVEAYAGVIRPVGHISDWEIPDKISSVVVHPTEWLSQAGRPYKIRKPSIG
ncbi:hypothetical protein Ddye_028990 [Dipteronia dyeriana]|uniref:Zinc finger PMZ-type domain-containing protein n=1 Tax=Dipteronia dyeriana TaxID=168575 RepID=A0AAD9TEC1_9ROSI|nr:hypothetical protein Ddye_028990 [Dipteronia dyeriana]